MDCDCEESQMNFCTLYRACGLLWYQILIGNTCACILCELRTVVVVFGEYNDVNLSHVISVVYIWCELGSSNVLVSQYVVTVLCVMRFKCCASVWRRLR